MKRSYELVFVGSAYARYFPRYKRWHEDLDSARRTATKVRGQLEERNQPFACHPPIVYGPGCGDSGYPVRWV